MAATSFLLLIAAAALLISPAISLTCNSRILTPRNTTFANCTALDALSAVLHWTYNPTASPKPTLTIAFTATPSQPDGWVAWALNPTGTGMVGAQSLVAFKDTKGSLVVKTYNISSKAGITESNISYGVTNASAVYYAGGNITIFATLSLPSASNEVNQVWQVGPVANGMVIAHAFDPANLKSMGKLKLVSGAADTPTEAPASSSAAPPASLTAPGPGSGGQGGNGTGSGAIVWGSGVGVYGGLVLLCVSYFVF